MDQYDRSELKSTIGNRLGGIGNPFRYRGLGKTGMAGQKNVVMDTMASSNLGGSSFTTTDTTQWVGIWAIYVNSFSPNWAAFFLGSQHIKHSAANAQFGMALYFYSNPAGAATGTIYNPMIIDNVQLPVQAQWFPFYINGISLMEALPIGRHIVYMAIRNYTTGTLTAAQPNIDFISSWGGPF